MFIPDPDFFYPSRISDPGSKNSNKREWRKKISCHAFLCSHIFHKIYNNFNFEVPKKKNLANFQRIIELFTQKVGTMLSKIWAWDPRSGIRKTYSGSRILGSKRPRILDLDPQHCSAYANILLPCAHIGNKLSPYALYSVADSGCFPDPNFYFPDPGSRVKKSTGSRILDPDSQQKI
jgi:hypothetical protein